MLRIRLRRMGKKKTPSYRMVVVDSRAPRNGAYIEQVGFYNPLTDTPEVNIEEEKVLKWLRNGASPSRPVEQMLQKKGILDQVKK